MRQFEASLAAHLQARVQASQQQGYADWQLWVQDESRCGLLPVVRRRITACGVQPLLPSAFCFDSLYLYGGVAPLTGDSFFLEFPTLNTDHFHLFLEHFAATAPTRFHLLLLDNGAFPKAHALHLPPNVGLLFFPPYAPELNPIARLWRDLKDRLAATVTLCEDSESGAYKIGVDEDGVHAVEGLLLARYMMFTQIYFHKTRAIYDFHRKGKL